MWDLIVSVPDHCLSFFTLVRDANVMLYETFKLQWPIYCVPLMSKT